MWFISPLAALQTQTTQIETMLKICERVEIQYEECIYADVSPAIWLEDKERHDFKTLAKMVIRLFCYDTPPTFFYYSPSISNK